MNPDNLITLAEFARRANISPSDVTRLISPQQIEPVLIGGSRFIDISVYPPSEFKKEKK